MKPISFLRLNKCHFGLSYPIPIEFKNDILSIGVPNHESLPNKTTHQCMFYKKNRGHDHTYLSLVNAFEL
jgi:hypothetical protein